MFTQGANSRFTQVYACLCNVQIQGLRKCIQFRNGLRKFTRNYLVDLLIDDTRSTQPQVLVSIGLSWFLLLQKRHVRALIYLWAAVSFCLYIKEEQDLAIPHVVWGWREAVCHSPRRPDQHEILSVSAVVEQLLEWPALHSLSTRVPRGQLREFRKV